MEKALVDFLKKHYGNFESATVTKDTGKTVWVTVDFGDDEIIKVTINRRKGENGNYRIVTEA